MIHSKKLLQGEMCTLTCSATGGTSVSLSCNGQSGTNNLTVPKGSIISYSIPAYGSASSKYGTVTMDSNKTLTATYSSSTSYTDVSYSVPRNMTAEGTLGGSSFAVQCTPKYGSRGGQMMFNGNTTGQTSIWEPTEKSTLPNGATFIMYFPTKVKLKTCEFMNRYNYANTAPASWTVYNSSNGSSWNTIKSGTNTNQNKGSNGGTWTVPVYNNSSTASTYYHNYYKFYFDSDWKYTSSAVRGIQECYPNAYYLSSTTSYSWSVSIS